jgi:hypothetical protein
MSIPLDRLYHYIEDIANNIFGNVVIYRFYPHGSKKIEDLSPLRHVHFRQDWYKSILSPEIFCNDQEPLNYHLYNNSNIDQHCLKDPKLDDILTKNLITFPTFNFRGTVKHLWDHALLLHSEKNSTQVDLYKACQFIPVYYWSHGVIAQDWFRFAQYISQKKQVKKLFLIYNRSWSGTREYRLQFLEKLIQNNLIDNCQTSVNPIESETHYSQHNFFNPIWKPQLILENYFPLNQVPSHYSADFVIEDYQSTDIEIVLETLFEDTRWHLTEKTLRPIACGQPFILAGTCGSLEYLRSYGFKTFDSVWDEQYDKISDPAERLKAIIDLMAHLAKLDPVTRANKIKTAQIIANYNKQHFFSKKFSNNLTSELHSNLATAFAELEKNNTSKYLLNRVRIAQTVPEWIELTKSITNRTKTQYLEIIAIAEQYYQRQLIQPE